VTWGSITAIAATIQDRGYDPTVSRIPALGPRGEGWLILQVVVLLAIPLAAWRASPAAVVETPAIAIDRQVGVVLLLGGLGLIGWSSAFLQTRRALSALPRPLASASLVQSGPYRVIRHPIYVGLILASAGVALVRVSVLVAILTVALVVVLDLKRRREEAWLLERFPEYAAYRAGTKALVPFVY
jgi:protein-S-isoprenylcysteine O-methyltransferase Ste14